MTSAGGSDCIELRPENASDLRSENARLHALLQAANVTAERYAVLLREGNHRIKNSLQIVSSLMSLQAGREQSATARDALHTAMTRIQSVARMHDALQETGGEDSVNVGAVLKKMCQSLQKMGGHSLGVKILVEAEAIHAPVAYAQPISLAVNELVVNALRHGFPDDRAGSIIVRLRQEGGQMQVLVSDDGVGLPDGHEEGNGYGMRMVRMMTAQVGGVLSIESGAGTRISIISPAPQGAVSAQAAPPQQTKPALVKSLAKGRSTSGALSRKPWKADGRG